ncbi:MAG: HEAT repeat domain-containing protein [Elusimicrobia bacterium]|nr:HEAT repeat domain-containing protein [Elusimicrobiota bacterium]
MAEPKTPNLILEIKSEKADSKSIEVGVTIKNPSEQPIGILEGSFSGRFQLTDTKGKEISGFDTTSRMGMDPYQPQVKTLAPGQTLDLASWHFSNYSSQAHGGNFSWQLHSYRRQSLHLRYVYEVASSLCEELSKTSQNQSIFCGKLESQKLSIKISDWTKENLLGTLEQRGTIIEDPAALELLISQGLKGKQAHVREAAAYSLGILRDEVAIKPISALLKDPDLTVRKSAAQALGKIASPKSIPFLLKTLEDDDIREEVAEALGVIGGKTVFKDLLATFLKQPGHSPKLIEALTKLLSPAAIQPLAQAFKKERNPGVRPILLRLLSDIQNPGTIPSLIEVLADSEYNLRQTAIQGLIKNPWGSLGPALLEASRSQNPALRQGAAEALGKAKNAAANKRLGELLTDADIHIRRKAATALTEAVGPLPEEALIQALKDSDSDVRKSSAYALRKAGSAKVIEALIQALEDSHMIVRDFAAASLTEITGQKLPAFHDTWNQWWQKNRSLPF